MTQSPPPEVYTSPVSITPTQANNQIHREVNGITYKSTSLAEAETALTNAVDTTSIFTNNT